MDYMSQPIAHVGSNRQRWSAIQTFAGDKVRVQASTSMIRGVSNCRSFVKRSRSICEGLGPRSRRRPGLFIRAVVGAAGGSKVSAEAGVSKMPVPTSIALNDGHRIPVLGMGVWRAGENVHNLVLEALRLGYRHFDCAADYENEKEVGGALAEAISKGVVKREDLFITTKLWNSDHKYVREAAEMSLKNLQLDYLDLYLVHFPIASKHTGVGNTSSALDVDGTLAVDVTVSLETVWRSMEGLVNAGLVRSIGISNYDVFLTRDVLAYSKIKPAVNQVEAHPYFQRETLMKFCQKHGIVFTAHTPLGGGAANIEMFGSVSALDDPVIKELAAKYKKTPAQIALRWGIQRNTVVIPKSSRAERLRENIDVFDFKLSDGDMKALAGVEKGARTNNPKQFWGMDLFA